MSGHMSSPSSAGSSASRKSGFLTRLQGEGEALNGEGPASREEQMRDIRSRMSERIEQKELAQADLDQLMQRIEDEHIGHDGKHHVSHEIEMEDPDEQNAQTNAAAPSPSSKSQSSPRVERELSALKKRAKKSVVTTTKELLDMSEVQQGKIPFVDHMAFELVIGFFILMNAVVIGIEVDTDLGTFGIVLQFFFATIWLVEAALKLYCYGACGERGYFCRFANLFDFVLMLLAIGDACLFFIPGLDLSRVTFVRILRLIRIVRFMRLLRMLRELWLLLSGLVSSLSALFWTLSLMAAVIYSFGILFAYLVGQECDSETFQDWDECHEFFATLPLAMYSLFEVMTLELGPVRGMVIRSPLMMLPMAVFIMFSSFGLMNIIMGVIVEKVLEAASANEEKLQKEKELRQKLEIDLLGEIFTQADADDSGKVSQEEFLQICERVDVKELFDDIELPVTRKRMAIRLFEVLDADNLGDLDITSFLERCLQLKTEGKKLTQDMTTLLVDVRHNSRRVARIEATLNKVDAKLDRLDNGQAAIMALLKNFSGDVVTREDTLRTAVM
mmetsp:Transcript_44319/g.79714  ORF Transcript_44319/g.79714 Transcript_44319/m.79714 type:complete len:558 (-) Transcript_44319:17-1690(-)